ncbi:MAG: hypothetical protein WAU01_07085, partial [Saprospiraceae bacterium]
MKFIKLFCFFATHLLILSCHTQARVAAPANDKVAQQMMTPEMLWQVSRVSGMGITKNGDQLVYRISTPNVQENKSSSRYATISLAGGASTDITEYKSLLIDKNVSPDGKYRLMDKSMKIEKVTGEDHYSDLPKSNAQIYT